MYICMYEDETWPLLGLFPSYTLDPVSYIKLTMMLDICVHVKCEFDKYTNLVISCKGLRSDQRVDLSNHYR